MGNGGQFGIYLKIVQLIKKRFCHLKPHRNGPEAPAALKYLHNNNETDNAVDHGITCRERQPVFHVSMSHLCGITFFGCRCKANFQ